MNYQTIKCSNCGNMFVWSSEEQKLYEERGVKTPDLCPICRGIIEARNHDQARTKYER